MSRAERLALYEVPEVQTLLRMLIEGSRIELSPEIHSVIGARYPKVEEVAGDPQKAKALLVKLAQAGILRPKFYEKIVACPRCGSKNLTFRYCCVHCQSHEIEKRADYRQVSIWFQCRSCGKRFDAPEGKHYCRACNSEFGVKESILDDAYSYVLDKGAETEFAREVLFLTPIKKILKDAGYELEASSVVRGASGASHSFDLVGSKTQENQEEIITLDIEISDKLCGEERVISVFAKKFDVSPTKSILIAIPALSETAKKLANLYELEIVEGAKPEEIAQGFRESLGKIFC